MTILMLAVLVSVIVNIIISLLNKPKSDFDAEKVIAPLKAELDRLTISIRNDSSNHKTEMNNLLSSIKTEVNQNLKDTRTELIDHQEKFRLTIEAKMDSFSSTLSTSTTEILKKQTEIRLETEKKLNDFNVAITTAIDTFSQTFSKKILDSSEASLKQQTEIRLETEKKLNDFNVAITTAIDTFSQTFSKKILDSSEASLKQQTEIRLETEKKLNDFNVAITTAIDTFSQTFSKKILDSSEASLKKQTEIRLETEAKLEQFSLTMNGAIDSLSQNIGKKLSEFGDIQKKNSDDYIKKHDEIKNATDVKLENIRKTVQDRLETLQEANSKKLDEMRMTVDEKLQQTLNTRLTESFKQVSEQLDKVHTGLGAMTSLANDVGGLKKVLTNVKTRGIIGEIQLESLLSSILSPEQYESNVQIKSNTQERVEFAIKLPGKDDSEHPVYLPIDSKFPDSAYQKLLQAYDDADTVAITNARKELVNAIKTSAKSIKDKYIDPPNTTEWGILFLPFEGLYAEVLQNVELVRYLQTEHHIMLTGPTTLGAFVNSLQMGFKTLAIQKSSSEVWQLLSAVKTQFGLFGKVLDTAQKKIRDAGEDLDKLVGTRTRMIQAKLKKVEEMPSQRADVVLEVLDLEEDS